MAGIDAFSARLQARMAELPTTMRRIAIYFDHNRAEVMSRSANELAHAARTSDATIIRTAKALGYSGLPQLKRTLADLMTETSPAEGFSQTAKASNADARRAAVQILALQKRQIDELDSDAQLENLMAVATKLHAARRIVLFGIGPTAHIVGYLSHLLARHGRETALLDTAGSALADQLLGLRQGDTVLAFSYGRTYPEVEAVMNEAAVVGVPIILVTDKASARKARNMEMVVEVPRGEARGMALHGSTMVWGETLVVALSLMDAPAATASLNRLSRLRKTLASN
ncbi:DNA-binding MurR/RpiR family transcriptional regulator [Devosia sp. 2618]